MVHATSKDALRQSLVGIAAEIQGTSFDEISREVGKHCIFDIVQPSN